MKPPDPSLTLVRTLPASALEVYTAWTNPRLFQQWMAPAPAVMQRMEADVRVGGRYRMELATPEGDVHTTWGEYRELVPGRRLVKTWIYEGPQPDCDSSETLLTVELRELSPGVTELTLRHERLPSASYHRSISQGWPECLNALEASLAASRGAARGQGVSGAP